MNGAERIGSPWPRRLLAVHSAAVYLFLYLPIAVLVVFSFNAARQTAVWDGFTLDWYRRLAADTPLLGAVRNSLAVAGMTTVASTVLGTLAALALGRLERSPLYHELRVPEFTFRAVDGPTVLAHDGEVGTEISEASFSVRYRALPVFRPLP